MKFICEPNRRCLKGLEFFYLLEDLDPDKLKEAVIAAFPGLYLGTEAWGPRIVYRAILNHRFEIRIGARPRQAHMIYRATSPLEQRDQDRQQLEQVLHQL